MHVAILCDNHLHHRVACCHFVSQSSSSSSSSGCMLPFCVTIIIIIIIIRLHVAILCHNHHHHHHHLVACYHFVSQSSSGCVLPFCVTIIIINKSMLTAWIPLILSHHPFPLTGSQYIEISVMMGDCIIFFSLFERKSGSGTKLKTETKSK